MNSEMFLLLRWSRSHINFKKMTIYNLIHNEYNISVIFLKEILFTQFYLFTFATDEYSIMTVDGVPISYFGDGWVGRKVQKIKIFLNYRAQKLIDNQWPSYLRWKKKWPTLWARFYSALLKGVCREVIFAR